MSNQPNRHSAEGQAKRDRAFVAETKLKRQRIELDDLRKQVFRAQETARIADEEALSLRQALASMTQSRDAARARNAALQGRIDAPVERPVDPDVKTQSMLGRIAAHFGRAA